MRRFLALAVAAGALAVIPVPTAFAAANTCNGAKTNITGSGKAEKFTLSTSKLVINSHGGNDVISAALPLASPATVCMGSGNDILKPTGGWDAVPVRYLDGGAGFDTAEIYVCFEESDLFPKIQIVSIEKLTIVNCQD
jgi:hypothetical protein